MTFSFDAGVRDSLSNLAASLGTGRDKAAHDAFAVFDLGRAQIEAMYRGDWLARKVVDIVPYDSVRAWRSWSGHRADVARFAAAERRLGLRKTIQRAMTLGRLYGGGAILIGDGETDIARLARPLDPRLPKDGLLYLHAVSRWQLGATELDLNPLSPWCGEPKFYTLSSPGLPPLELHPSRVVRFLGNPLPDPSAIGTPWSDSVLQALYDAVHAAALSLAGATSLLHEAKVDVVTVPNLSEHLSSAETTAQLSARFAYAAAMKSMNNLLLLGDGESWSRQSVDFAGLPEMARTFLQVAAGAADIPVTRLLGQSPAGLSATGESDVRNYYDMIAARQELDLRPQLERLDRLICWSEDIDEGALTFAFRPLWQLDEPARAALALSKAQAMQVYAGLKLWPDAVMARLAEAQLVADGTYPNAAAVFAEAGASPDAGQPQAALDFSPTQPRDLWGRWTAGEQRSQNSDPSTESVEQPRSGEGPHSPDGTPIRLAIATSSSGSESLEAPAVMPVAFKGRGRRWSNAVRALLSAAARLWRRWRPDEADETPFEPLPNAHDLQASPTTSSTAVSEEKDQKIRSGPPGLVITVAGSTPRARGLSYEAQVRKELNVQKSSHRSDPQIDPSLRKLRPEGTIGMDGVEIKYTDDFSKSIYGPSRDLPFIGEIDKTVEQAKNYMEIFKRGNVIFVTNDIELARYYVAKFEENKLSRYSFIIIPAIRGAK